MKTPCTKKILNFVAALLFTVLLPKEGKGQTVLELDFKTKKFNDTSLEKIQKLKPGDTYILVINSINMNIYDVIVGGEDTFFISSATFPVFSEIATDNLVSLFSSLVTSTETINSATPKAKELEKLQEKLANATKRLEEKSDTLAFLKTKNKSAPLIRKYFNVSSEIDQDSSLEEHTEKVENEVEELNNEIAYLKNSISQVFEEMEASADRKNQLYSELAKLSLELKTETGVFLETVQEINRLLAAINFQHYSYYSGLYDNSAMPEQDYGFINLAFISEKVGELMAKLEESSINTNEMYATYKMLEFDFSKEKEDFKLISDTATKLRMTELLSGITTLKAEISAGKGQLRNDSLYANYMKLLFLENNAERAYRSLPIQMKGDGQTVNIEIKPRNPAFGLSSYKTEYTFPSLKFYAGVSAGYYYAFGLQDDFYSIRETRGLDTTFTLIKENQSKGEVGFNALLHAGGRINNTKCGLHLSLGPGFSVGSNTQFRMMAGGGVSYGATRSKLTLDVLYITGYVMKLSDAYTEDYQSTERPTQVTVSKRNSSVALSIGYMYKF